MKWSSLDHSYWLDFCNLQLFERNVYTCLWYLFTHHLSRWIYCKISEREERKHLIVGKDCPTLSLAWIRERASNFAMQIIFGITATITSSSDKSSVSESCYKGWSTINTKELLILWCYSIRTFTSKRCLEKHATKVEVPSIQRNC